MTYNTWRGSRFRIYALCNVCNLCKSTSTITLSVLCSNDNKCLSESSFPFVCAFAYTRGRQRCRLDTSQKTFSRILTLSVHLCNSITFAFSTSAVARGNRTFDYAHILTRFFFRIEKQNLIVLNEHIFCLSHFV